MSLDVFKAYIQGYSDRLFDKQLLSVQSGYWAAYYTNAKHPKSVQQVMTDLVMKHKLSTSKHKSGVAKPEVDVDAFIATENRFLKRLQSK